jgi:hypothetical protein
VDDRAILSLRQSIKAHKMWANIPDRTQATAKARAAAEGRWLREVREKFPDVDEATAQQMADSARIAYFREMALKRELAKRARREAAQLEAEADAMAGDVG